MTSIDEYYTKPAPSISQYRCVRFTVVEPTLAGAIARSSQGVAHPVELAHDAPDPITESTHDRLLRSISRLTDLKQVISVAVEALRRHPVNPDTQTGLRQPPTYRPGAMSPKSDFIAGQSIGGGRDGSLGDLTWIGSVRKKIVRNSQGQ